MRRGSPAQFHFLVLPRLPFVHGREVAPEELDSLASLLKSPSAAFVLACLDSAGKRVRLVLTDHLSNPRINAPHGTYWKSR